MTNISWPREGVLSLLPITTSEEDVRGRGDGATACGDAVPAGKFSDDHVRVTGEPEFTDGMSMGLGARAAAVGVGAPCAVIELRVSGAVAMGRETGLSPTEVVLPFTDVSSSLRKERVAAGVVAKD